MKINRKPCKVCGNFFGCITNKKYCSKSCFKANRNKKYHELTKSKTCTRCGVDFKGKKQEARCENCKGIFDVVEIQKPCGLKCRRCRRVYDLIERACTENSKDGIVYGLCSECIQKSREASSKRMQERNPMHKAECRARVASTVTGKKTNVEDYRELKNLKPRMTREDMSRAMKLKNPMNKPASKQKMMATMRFKIDSGDIAYKRGKDHHLWKGNRKRSFTIRSRLYNPWIKPILARDDYTCQKCGIRGGRLEVHHASMSFADAVLMFCDGRSLEEMTDIEFENVCEKIIEHHKEIEGTTYCVECHKKVDVQRR